MKQRDLPNRMYAHGLAYRYVPKDGVKVNLGRDLDQALRKYHILTAEKPKYDPTTQAVAIDMWRRHRKGAKQRGIVYSITVDDIVARMAAQQHRCAITNLPFDDTKPAGVRIRPWLPSVDRINSRHEYHPDNIRIVCAFVNVAMNGFGDEFFHAILQPLVDAAVKSELVRLGVQFPHGNSCRTSRELTLEETPAMLQKQ